MESALCVCSCYFWRRACVRGSPQVYLAPPLLTPPHSALCMQMSLVEPPFLAPTAEPVRKGLTLWV